MQTHQRFIRLLSREEINAISIEMECHTKSMEPEINFDVFIFKVSRPMNYALLIAMKHFIFRLCSSLAVVAIKCALKYVC